MVAGQVQVGVRNEMSQLSSLASAVPMEVLRKMEEGRGRERERERVCPGVVLGLLSLLS